MPELNHTKIQLVTNPDFPHILEVELLNYADWKKYDSLEFHWVVYPYSREVSANDLSFHPFEEYVKDILDNHKSAYSPIYPSNHKRFGLFLGLIAALVVSIFHPQDFVSMEGLVSFFGAYIAGKELWTDFEKYLVRFTKKSKLKFLEPYYSYQLEKNSTLAQYSAFAKKHRYEKSALTPEKMDYIEQSNSKTVRLQYDSLVSDPEVHQEALHLLSLHIDSAKLEAMKKDGYLFGVKVSLNKRKGFFSKNTELYQSLNNGENGALDLAGKWIPNVLAKRITYTFGRWKYYQETGKMVKGTLIERIL